MMAFKGMMNEVVEGIKQGLTIDTVLLKQFFGDMLAEIQQKLNEYSLQLGDELPLNTFIDFHEKDKINYFFHFSV